MTWYVRRASMHDKLALEALCLDAVGPDDYVLPYLDDLILRSVVHVALAEKDRVVGMMSYRPALDGTGWLGQARTHPEFRRQGVASALIDSFVGIARASNVPALRLWSDASNEDGIASFSSCGFHEVGRFGRVKGAAARGVPKSLPSAFDEDLWKEVNGASVIRKGKGYAHHEHAFVSATRPVVFAVAAKRAFRRWDRNVLSLQEQRERDDELWFTMWAGDAAEVLAEVCRLAYSLGRAHVQTFLPYDRELLSEARRAGYEEGTWGKEAVLAELLVPAGHIRKRTRPTYGELAAKRFGQGHA
jgi:GNAT superfamily N-acetyltransferase